MSGKLVWTTMTATFILGFGSNHERAIGAAIAVNTVGAYSPGVVGGPTNNDAVSNAGANTITLAAFKPLVSTAFASNTGGVVDFEVANGFVVNTTYGDGAANPITASYGTALNQTIGIWRTDIDPATVAAAGINTNTNNGLNVVSGTAYMGVPAVTSPINLSFGKGLSTVGFTLVPRGALRNATMSALLNDTTTLAGSTEQISAANAPGAFFWGFRAPAGKTIVGLNITSPDGFSRFDDLGFVVAAIPEPSCLALLGTASLGMMFRQRRRRVGAMTYVV